MPHSSRVVLVLHGDPAIFSAVRAAATPHTIVSQVPDWPGLTAGIRETPPSTVSVVDPYFGTSRPGLAPELHALLQRMPSACVIAALEIEEGRARDVVTLDDWGVAGLITTGHDDTTEAIQQRLGDARAFPLKRLVGTILPPETSPQAYTLVFAAVDATCESGTVADFAEALGASPSTLLRWTEETGLPTPRTLLQWMRVLLATKFLGDPERDIEEVARATGYASTGELRRVTQRHLGMTPAQLRSPNALTLVADRFIAALSGSTV